MTYNPNLPLSTDKIRNFPGDVTTNNWPRITANFNADHNFANSVTATQGYHTGIHFVDKVTTDPTTVAGVGQLYTKTPTAYTVPNQYLFYKGGTGTVVQMNGTFSATGTGWATIPGGFIMLWSTFSPTTSSLPILFPNMGYSAAGFPNNCFSIQMTVNIGAPVECIPEFTALTKTGFTYTGTNTTAAPGVIIYYLAIGN